VTYPDKLEIIPLSKPPVATIRVPGSKSITNRALVLAALSSIAFNRTLRGALRSEDTEVMVNGLRKLGYQIETEWPLIRVIQHGSDKWVPADAADIFVGNSGTTMRFLTALCAIGQGRFRLDGVHRMRERPIEDLIGALRECRVKAYSENGNGCPPVVVEGNGWFKSHGTFIKGNVSSQFISGLLMVAPFHEIEPFTIGINGPLVSQPYVEMTLAMMQQWGARWRQNPGELVYEFGDDSKAEYFGPEEYEIEPDASAASYFFAAAGITRGKLIVPQTGYVSAFAPRVPLLQGDWRFVDLLGKMGCSLTRGVICAEQHGVVKSDGTARWAVEYGTSVSGAPLHGIDVDMNDISDTVMTLAAVACFAEGPTTIRNVAHIRHKETDRLAALATELRKVGAEVVEFNDGLTITPRPLHGAEIDTYNDHRMAMSMALIGLKVPGIVIKNPGCVAKTYPGFWQDLEKLRSEN
jgi:3-phosphoshikimate 1-carboxyvinyltransferase